MKKYVHIVLILALTAQWSSCSTSPASINYQGFDSDVRVQTGTGSGKNLGPVRGNEGGAIWNDCNDKAAESLRSAIVQAKGLGANAIGDLKWFASGDSNASCKKSWGYFAFWPLVLTPLFMSTEVEGVAYKVSGSSKHSGLYLIPEGQGQIDALVHAIITAKK